MRKVKTQYTLNKFVRNTFLGVSLLVFLVAFITGIFLDKNEIRRQDIKSTQGAHNTLSALISPNMAISNTRAVRNFLTLSSSSSMVFVIVDEDNNVFMPDYDDIALIKAVTQKPMSLQACSQLRLKEVSFSDHSYFAYCTPIKYKGNVVDNKPKMLGYLLSFQKYSSDAFLLKNLIYFLLIITITLSVLIIWIRSRLYKRLLKPLIRLEKEVYLLKKKALSKSSAIQHIGEAPIEVVRIKDAFNQLIQSLRNENTKRIATEKRVALHDAAIQIAHDIRSPLAALTEATKLLPSIPESERTLIRNATRRINDIANNLLIQYNAKRENDAHNDPNKIDCSLLYELLSEIVSEKKLQYYTHQIDLDLEVSRDAYSIFCDINPTLFKQVISNLVNNAIEAVSNKLAIVQISLSRKDSKACLLIQDNGCGISKSLLDKILEGGYTTKQTGSGIGLASAIKQVTQWSGQLLINSIERQGTTLTLLLPISKHPPRWFADRLYFPKKGRVIICDDDQSIHDTWAARLNKLSASQLALQNFYNPDDLLSDLSQLGPSTVCLIDYEFIAHKLTGLDVIEKATKQCLCYLVTSRYHSERLQQRAEKLGVKIVPKNLAFQTKINIVSTVPDCILLEDSETLCKAWFLTARKKNINLEYFTHVGLLESKIRLYPRDVLIYIDSDLGDDIKGELFAKHLYELGYFNLYLTTGSPPESFKQCSWLKGVIGKTPPF